MISQPSRHCTVELQALPSRIGQVRRIVSAQLRYWHLDPLIDLAELGVTELLTNVHRHVEPDKRCTVEMELRSERLTLSVHDHDPRLPEIRDDDVPADAVCGDAACDDLAALATCGRGLAMVAAVSESWGVRPHGDGGKVVWFTLPAPAPAKALPPTPVHTAITPLDTDVSPRPAPHHAPARSAVAG
ncbi:ATP-binding protein [Streptomyces sp. NPDC046939]|uniref:ATP-binding protein n=1 Tax=Streptomyces sp. NPDC046939 TaxID=3155376 RepID=UPI0033CCD00B